MYRKELEDQKRRERIERRKHELSLQSSLPVAASRDSSRSRRPSLDTQASVEFKADDPKIVQYIIVNVELLFIIVF